MRALGVVGLGTMGLGIAQVLAATGLPVLATDARAEVRDGARDRLAERLGERVATGRMTVEERETVLSRLIIVAAPASMGAAGLVVEAIIEELGAKRDLFLQLEKVVGPETVLATNTSSLPVASIAEGLLHRERVLGLHFFNPAPAMRLVELVRTPATSGAALAVARQVTEVAGKTVVECGDSPGFIVNRCARPFYGEALALLEEGRQAAEIDAAMLASGYRMGPLSLIDLIGADINLAATRGLAHAMGEHPRYHVFRALETQVEAGALGRKTGRGFLFPNAPSAVPEDASEIARRIEATLVNEAGWLVSEGSATAEAIDTAMRLGLNFPRGPFETLEARGRAEVGATLAALEARAPAHLKGRYAPAPILMEHP